MFTKTFFALALSISSALALSITTPSGVTASSTFNITWSSTSSDPIFSIELVHQSFNDALALANNVNPGNNSITVSVGPVPAGDGYALEFVNVTNINQVFATSGDFSIAAAVSSISSASTTVGASTTGSATVTTSGALSTATAPSASGSAASKTASGSNTISSSGSSPTNSASGSSAPSTSPSSGALPLRLPVGTMGASLLLVIMSMVAGAGILL